MKKAYLMSIVIIVVILVAGGAFYGGMIYGKGQSASSASAARSAFAGMRGGRTGAAGAGLTSGSIIAKDNTSITLQLPNNAGSKIIFYSDATQIGKFTTGTSDDLTNGTTVSVTGTANSDGSVTAQNIQIRPTGK